MLPNEKKNPSKLCISLTCWLNC